MKTIERQHRNALKLTSKERNATVLVEEINHSIGGALQTEIRRDDNYYYFLTYGRWSDACAIAYDEYKQLETYEKGYQDFLNANALDVV